jgi:hypothetical protein
LYWIARWSLRRNTDLILKVWPKKEIE